MEQQEVEKCELCGEPMQETVILPNGATVRKEHEPNSQECNNNQRNNAGFDAYDVLGDSAKDYADE